MAADEVGRPIPDRTGDELATLLGFLEFQRATLAWKCGDLDDEQLRRTLRPSTITLGGLLKHLAFVEDYWCTIVVGGQDPPEPWASADWSADPDWEWHSAADDSGPGLRELWLRKVAASRAVVGTALAGGPGALDRLHTSPGSRDDDAARPEVSLRWVLLHLIEEYARHNGHADLVRESIDGMTGE